MLTVNYASKSFADRSLRVLFVVSWDGGGIPTAMKFVAEKLRARGVRFSAFFFNGYNPDSRWNQFCDHLYSNKEQTLTELLTREKFDIVHLTDTACPPPYHADLWIRRARYAGGIVCMSQNGVQELLPDQFAHVFVASSEGSRQVMARTIAQPIRVIFNGIDTALFCSRPVETPERPILAWVGRASDFNQKDTHGFLHLAASLYDSEYDFWIADLGRDADKLRMSDWFGERIRYFSCLDLDEMPEFYSRVAQSGGALIATSTFEGFHLALAEGALCGCPIIAPRVIGLEWIEQDDIGMVYDRYDALRSIHQYLNRLKDPDFRQELVTRAQCVIQRRYNSEQMAEGYYQAYQDAIGQAQSHKDSLSARVQRQLWAAGLQARRKMRR